MAKPPQRLSVTEIDGRLYLKIVDRTMYQSIAVNEAELDKLAASIADIQRRRNT